MCYSFYESYYMQEVTRDEALHTDMVLGHNFEGYGTYQFRGHSLADPNELMRLGKMTFLLIVFS